MDDVFLTPELEQFAADAVAAGRYRDVAEIVQADVSLLQRVEAARAALLASVLAAQEGANREGCVSLDAFAVEMRGTIANTPTGAQ